MTKYSAPIGRLIPKIEIGVYSWRMLTLTSFVVAMLAGACIEAWSAVNRMGRSARLPLNDGTDDFRSAGGHAGPPLRIVGRNAGLSLLIVASMTILIGALAASAWYVAWPMWRGQSFEPNPGHYNIATLPRGVPRDLARHEGPHRPNDMEQARLVSGSGRATIESWAPELRKIRVEMEKPDQLQFRTSNFAGWTATLDGRLVEIKEDAFKNIVLDLPAGAHMVALELRSTPIRRAGNIVTILSLALLFSIIIAAIRFKAA